MNGDDVPFTDQAQEIERSPLGNEVYRLGRALAEIEEQVGMLRDQLAPVMRNEPNNLSEELRNVEEPIRSELSATLASQAREAQKLRDRLMEIRSVLDV